MSYYLHLWKNSCLEVVFHFFSSVAMVNTPRKMKIGLYQMGQLIILFTSESTIKNKVNAIYLVKIG
jgi:hypothetical protein